MPGSDSEKTDDWVRIWVYDANHDVIGYEVIHLTLGETVTAEVVLSARLSNPINISEHGGKNITPIALRLERAVFGCLVKSKTDK